MTVERGIMIMKNGMAWGKVYADGRSSSYGWMDPESAPIFSEEFIRKPTDATYEGSHYIEELEKGSLVRVERTTTVKIISTP